MKTLNLALLTFLIIGHSTLAWSQADTSAETATNETLIQNAKESRAAIEAKETVKQEIRALGKGQSTSSGNLTDQEKQLSENYVHQGMANEIIKENCSGDMATVCNGNEGKHKFLGMDATMMKAVSQAYAMFGAVGGDFASVNKGAAALKKDAAKGGGENVAPEGGDKKAAKANDYCKYIPTATEGIATATQLATTKELTEEVGNGDTAQKDGLLKAAKSHDSRAKMAQVQAAGWWGGAACYAVNAATGQFAVNPGLAIKMGAATLLGAFYQGEVKANKDYAEKTRAIAEKLPGKGDCNPITDKVCYCSQPSTESDPTYCLPGLHKKKIAASSYRMACTDDKMKLDPTCACEKTSTCFDNYLSTQSDGSLDLGGLGSSNSPFSGIRSLARGELVGGTVNSSSYDQTAAIARQGLRDIASKLDNDYDLNKEQKGLVDAMVSKGVPANVAALMATNPPSSQATNSAMAKLSGMSSGRGAAAALPRVSNIIDFTGGNGVGIKGKSNSNNADDILAKLNPGAKGNNSKIVEFAQKAEEQAQKNGQIRKNDTPLFEIISLRYQTSGRKRLEVDAGK